MKLVTFELNAPTGKLTRLGLMVDDRKIIDLNLAYAGLLSKKQEKGFAHRLANAILPPDMIGYFQSGDWGRDALDAVHNEFCMEGYVHGPEDQNAVFPIDGVRLLAPVPRPNTIRDFSTYEEHQERVTRAKGNAQVPEVWYRMPVYWKANPDNTLGPDEDILWPDYTDRLDFELEYGVFIGKTGRDIPLEEAAGYIAGYTIFNDVSARDQQAEEMVMTFGPSKGKDFDESKVMGPCLVTPDEFGDKPHRMTARINGETWSQGSTDGMYWSFPQLIAYISQSETLFPGDFLGSGACATGCGLELNRWIQPGDLVELEVEGIGILKNRVIRKKGTDK
jgi:2-keto-4-pentenoate hydratase/2-oxohepta-3-ene-1,7-dioic acid hydratase in catechol pathway